MRARVFTLVPVLWCLASPSLAAGTGYSTRLFPAGAEGASGAGLSGGVPLAGSTEVIRGMLTGGRKRFDVLVSPMLVVSLNISFLALSGGNTWWRRFTYAQPLTTASQPSVNLGIFYHFY